MRALPSLGGDDDAPTSAPVKFPNRWVDEFEAIRITGRSARTLKRWRLTGQVRGRVRGTQHVFEVSELLAALAENDRRIDARRRLKVGRPRHAARPRVRRLLEQGLSVKQVAEICECNRDLVRAVKREMAKNEN